MNLLRPRGVVSSLNVADFFSQNIQGRISSVFIAGFLVKIVQNINKNVHFSIGKLFFVENFFTLDMKG